MKKAFTLIEVLISVGLLSILILFIYKTLGTMKKSNDIYGAHYQMTSIGTKIHKTMFLDLAQSVSANVVKGDFDRLILQSRNSYFGIIEPYIAYIVKEGILYRIESNKEIKPKIQYDSLKNIKFEIVKRNVKKFKVFKAKNSFLIVVDDLIFEVAK
jgi:prepilin-type N-terminal cleavage/methylation domain-containing protein